MGPASGPLPLPGPVAAAVASWPPRAQAAFHTIRGLLREIATDPRIGPLTETLKWGEPAFLTEATKSGSALRVAWKARAPGRIGLYVNCRTSLAETVREIHPYAFTFEGRRGLLVALDRPLPEQAVRHAADLALRYHLRA